MDIIPGVFVDLYGIHICIIFSIIYIYIYVIAALEYWETTYLATTTVQLLAFNRGQFVAILLGVDG